MQPWVLCWVFSCFCSPGAHVALSISSAPSSAPMSMQWKWQQWQQQHSSSNSSRGSSSSRNRASREEKKSTSSRTYVDRKNVDAIRPDGETTTTTTTTRAKVSAPLAHWLDNLSDTHNKTAKRPTRTSAAIIRSSNSSGRGSGSGSMS